MEFRGTIIDDTFAEAFRMWAARLIVTAIDEAWVMTAVREVTGYASSVIGCDAEAGLERLLSPDETPDGRHGASILFFAFNADKLAPAVLTRTGQCLMTCPTTAVFDGMPQVQPVPKESARLDLGKKIRFFGDGKQKSKVIDGRRFWRIPVMDGEFLVEESVGAVRAIGGGNFLICGTDQKTTLAATKKAVNAIAAFAPPPPPTPPHRSILVSVDRLPGVIAPFPGGIVRSGSKVGSRYKALFASSNDEFSPTLGQHDRSKLHPGVGCVYEIVINGITEKAIAQVMGAGIAAACGPGVVAISAGNYGGTLGKFHFKLREIMAPVLTASSAPPQAPKAYVRQRFTPPLGYTLEWKETVFRGGDHPTTIPIDGSVFRPDILGRLGPQALHRVPIQVGRETEPLGELFDISGQPGDTLTLNGAPAFNRLGAGMKSGRLVIDGHAGDDLGASMRGGLIRVYGSAGRRVGGPDLDQDRGMDGGTILVTEDSDEQAGFRMRRGLIVIGGNAGPQVGYRMLAGTLVMMRGPLENAGLEMRRGTIVCLDPEAELIECRNVAPAGVFDSNSVVALRVLINHLIELGCAVDHRAIDGKFRLSAGDRFELGRGDIWQWVS